MLKDNLKAIRKSRGISQEELAIKLNVVRQTVSKWENGLSVPDSDMLITISEIFETPVSVLLGETVTVTEANDLKAISEKLEVINLQLARNRQAKRKAVFWLCVAVSVLTVAIAVCLIWLNSPYLDWDYMEPETAVIGTVYHVFEYVFVRFAPFIFIGTVVGAVLVGKRR